MILDVEDTGALIRVHGRAPLKEGDLAAGARVNYIFRKSD